MPEPVQAVQGRSLANATAVELSAGSARWRCDLAPSAGGAGNDPTPHELLDSAIAACTLLTLQLYAKRKNYPLHSCEVRVQRDESADTYRLQRQLTVAGPLDAAQRADLLRVANACPIHKALHKRFEIETTLDAGL
jgi:putative redox protein